jgi:putative Holliday junction resolvase
MGIDWGFVRTGVAISDESWDFVFPRGIIKGEAIAEFVKSEKIEGIVIGLPLYADGTDSKTTGKVREFADFLAAQVSVPIGFIEENLTSVEAGEYTKDKAKLDSEAAAVILENAIAMIKRLRDV